MKPHLQAKSTDDAALVSVNLEVGDSLVRLCLEQALLEQEDSQGDASFDADLVVVPSSPASPVARSQQHLESPHHPVPPHIRGPCFGRPSPRGSEAGGAGRPESGAFPAAPSSVVIPRRLLQDKLYLPPLNPPRRVLPLRSQAPFARDDDDEGTSATVAQAGLQPQVQGVLPCGGDLECLPRGAQHRGVGAALPAPGSVAVPATTAGPAPSVPPVPASVDAQRLSAMTAEHLMEVLVAEKCSQGRVSALPVQGVAHSSCSARSVSSSSSSSTPFERQERRNVCAGPAPGSEAAKQSPRPEAGEVRWQPRHAWNPGGDPTTLPGAGGVAGAGLPQPWDTREVLRGALEDPSRQNKTLLPPRPLGAAAKAVGAPLPPLAPHGPRGPRGCLPLAAPRGYLPKPLQDDNAQLAPHQEPTPPSMSPSPPPFPSPRVSDPQRLGVERPRPSSPSPARAMPLFLRMQREFEAREQSELAKAQNQRQADLASVVSVRAARLAAGAPQRRKKYGGRRRILRAGAAAGAIGCGRPFRPARRLRRSGSKRNRGNGVQAGPCVVDISAEGVFGSGSDKTRKHRRALRQEGAKRHRRRRYRALPEEEFQELLS